MADKIMETTRSIEVAGITPSSSGIEAEVVALDTATIYMQRGTDPGLGEIETRTGCFYHYRFKENARKCYQPCH